MRTHDVVIIGGGPVGVMLAVSLIDRGFDVVVWEARVDEPRHSRAIGVHPPSLDLFDRLGLADDLLVDAVRIRRGVARTSSGRLGTVPFDHASSRWPFVAAVPQRRTEAVLRAALDLRRPGALRRGTTFVELRQLDDQVVVTGTGPEGPEQVAARFVVGADGTQSPVRAALEVGSSVRDLPDRYLMGDFADQTGQGQDAVIHLEREGVVESFPLPGATRRFVAHVGSASSSPGTNDARGDRTPPPAAAVARLVTERTGLVVDPATATMTSAFGVRRRLADRTVVGRVVLVGDAAHEISPIGGQGMNLGWLDADALVDTLARALSRAGARRLDPRHFDRFAADRARAARRAARQAEWNTGLGRPVGAASSHGRDLALRAVLGLPTRHLLAGVYAMRWA